MQKLPAQPNKSLIDGIAVLQELSARGCPVSCLELSSWLGLEKTRVNRILKTLAYLGIVKSVSGRRYMPGDAMHILAAQSIFASGLLWAAGRRLSRLNELNMVVALGVLWRDKTTYLYHHNPGQESFEGLGALGLYPVGRSSVGMVLSATKEGEELAWIYPDRAVEGWNRSYDEFLSELAAIRSRGYADVEYEDGHRSIAVTVGSHPFAAIALAGNITISELPRLVEILKETAEEIAAEIEQRQRGE